MKTRLLICTLVLSGVLNSCQDNRAVSLDPTPPVRSSKECLHLDVRPPSEVTLRASSEDPMRLVQSLRLLFYNNDTSVLEHIREVQISSAEQLRNLTVDLPRSNYKLVVLANPTARLLELTQLGAPLSRLTVPNPIKSPDLYSLSKGDNQVTSVVMSPEQGAVSIDESAFTRPNASGGNTISIKLEPAVARVLAYGVPVLKGGNKGTASARFVVNSLPTKVAVLRPLGLLANGSQEVVGDDSEPRDRYASGSLFAAWQGKVPSSLEGLVVHHRTLPLDSYWAKVGDNLSQAQNMLLAANYAKESVLPAQAYLQGAVPCVVIAYPYVPAGVQLQSNEGWVSFEGEHYSESAFRQLVTSPSANTNAQLAQAIQRASLSAKSFESAFDKEGIKFYKNALSYYVVYIRHFSDEQAPELSSVGRYGIVRNNEYRLRLRSISMPGSPVFPDLSKQMRPLSELYRMKSAIVVQPTITREFDVDL